MDDEALPVLPAPHRGGRSIGWWLLWPSEPMRIRSATAGSYRHATYLVVGSVGSEEVPGMQETGATAEDAVDDGDAAGDAAAAADDGRR